MCTSSTAHRGQWILYSTTSATHFYHRGAGYQSRFDNVESDLVKCKSHLTRAHLTLINTWQEHVLQQAINLLQLIMPLPGCTFAQRLESRHHMLPLSNLCLFGYGSACTCWSVCHTCYREHEAIVPIKAVMQQLRCVGSS